MNDNNFEERFEQNLREGPETIDLEGDQTEDFIEEVSELNLPYEEVLIDAESGESYIYDVEDDSFEEITQEASQNYLKEFIMEYQDEWRETDIDEPVPEAEAYMFRI